MAINMTTFRVAFILASSTLAGAVSTIHYFISYYILECILKPK